MAADTNEHRARENTTTDEPDELPTNGPTEGNQDHHAAKPVAPPEAARHFQSVPASSRVCERFSVSDQFNDHVPPSLMVMMMIVD